MRGQRERLRARGRARRRDRPLQLGVRADPDPDPQPGAGRAGGDDQSVEHLSGLTRDGCPRPWGYRGEPDVFYPTGRATTFAFRPRTTCRAPLMPCSRAASGSERVRARRRDGVGKGLLTDPFMRAAGELGCAIAGAADFDAGAGSTPPSPTGRALRRRRRRARRRPLRRRRPVLKALRARLGPRLTIMAGFHFGVSAEISGRGPAGRRGRVRDHVRPRRALRP